VELLAAVMDGLGWERASLVGGSSGGCAAVAFAARFPERVDRLLLYGAYASGASIAPPAARDAIVSTVRGHWGLGSRVLADIFLGDARSAERDAFVRHQRAATDAETAAALLELASGMDVRALLDRVRAPTVVVRRRGDRAIPYACAPELAASIPDARLIPVEGSAHFPWVGNSMSVARAMRLRLLPERPAGPHASAVSVLSAREREVLALVATGMTDREIAERLTVSPTPPTATSRTSGESSAAARGRRRSPRPLAWDSSDATPASWGSATSWPKRAMSGCRPSHSFELMKGVGEMTGPPRGAGPWRRVFAAVHDPVLCAAERAGMRSLRRNLLARADGVRVSPATGLAVA
jgi:hypothetical protein